uniref:Uncharacterized protein n=1 Tax=Arundo donax TaxID=35708 RepID=A0A0A8Y862_ARUDO
MVLLSGPAMGCWIMESGAVANLVFFVSSKKGGKGLHWLRPRIATWCFCILECSNQGQGKLTGSENLGLEGTVMVQDMLCRFERGCG